MLTLHSVTSMLPVLIVHLLQMRSSRSHKVRNLHLNRYNLCMMFLRELGDVYSHAIFYHEFFELASSANNTTVETSPVGQDPLIRFLEQRSATRNGERNGTRTPNNERHRRTILSNKPVRQPQPDAYLEAGSIPPSFATTYAPNMANPNTPGNESPVIDSNSEQPASRVGYPNNQASDPAENEFDVRFEEWLASYDHFQNIFPSA